MRRAGMFAWGAALAVLAAALVFFNAPAPVPPEAAEVYAGDVPEGHAPGERLPDFALDCMDGGRFALSDHRGQVTVVNLWATWCGPCVKELPNFDRLPREYPGEVAVLAIHSDLITDDVGAYLSNYDYEIPFAVDASGDVIRALGGSTLLPQTVIVDRSGAVTYNEAGSLTWEALSGLVEAAMGEGGSAR